MSLPPHPDHPVRPSRGSSGNVKSGVGCRDRRSSTRAGMAANAMATRKRPEWPLSVLWGPLKTAPHRLAPHYWRCPKTLPLTEQHRHHRGQRPVRPRRARRDRPQWPHPDAGAGRRADGYPPGADEHQAPRRRAARGHQGPRAGGAEGRSRPPQGDRPGQEGGGEELTSGPC